MAAKPPTSILIGGDDAESLVGGVGDDIIRGYGGNDTIIGGDGDDVLLGGDGDDYIVSGPGADLVTGDAGNDTLIVGGDGDIVLAGEGDDLIILRGPGGDWSLGGSIDGGPGYDTLDYSWLLEQGYDVTIEDIPECADKLLSYTNPETGISGKIYITCIENFIPCFTLGTLIATPDGERRVEDLRIGDRVITRDNGIQRISWIGRRDLGAEEIAIQPALAPVLICKGSLGNGLPERDMRVSPNHRMLISNERTALYFDEHEVLVAAKHLVGLAGVTREDACATTYIHVMFDRHEVVLGDGAWSESFNPGDQALGALGAQQREEIFALFPELKVSDTGFAMARRALRRHEAALLIA